MEVNSFVFCKVQAGFVVTHKSVDDFKRQRTEGRGVLAGGVKAGG